MITRIDNKKIDLPIVLVGGNFSPLSATSDDKVETANVLQAETAEASDTDSSDPLIDLDIKAFTRDALVRIARQDGLTLDEERRKVLGAQVARGQCKAVQVEEFDLMEQVVGYAEIDRRTFKAVVHKETKSKYPKHRKPRKLTEELGDDARGAKWMTFESLDTEAFLLAAEAMGMKVAFVTFKVPKVENWIEFEAASTPTKFKGKEGALQRTLKTFGAKFQVPGFGPAWHGVWVLENTTMKIKRPHSHAVMMVPPDGGEDFIRETWLKKTGFPAGAPDDAVHIRWEDEGDGRSVVEQFLHASRYLSRKKYDQEKVNQEWLDRSFEVGHMWDARGFKLFPKTRFAIKRKHVEPIREVMNTVTSRPATVVDETTGEVKVNPYGRWVQGSAYGNREIMDDTSEISDRLRKAIEAEENLT